MTDRLIVSVARIVSPRLLGMAFLFAVGLIAFAGASLVAAQRGGSGGPPAPDAYQGCVNNHTGVLRIVGAGQVCQDHETAIALGSSSGDAALLERIEELESENDALQQENVEQQGAIDALGDRVAELETNPVGLPACLTTVAVNGQERDDIVFEGCNVHVLSGAGITSGEVNGVGNLIVGYNENDGDDERTGSHNLVIGPYHSYTNYGGLVAGYDNAANGRYSSLSGTRNTANGIYSSVSGGRNNTANGSYSSVSGGVGNTTDGAYSSVSGGFSNIADGETSSISGGLSNTANGAYSNVSGGAGNTADGRSSSVSGGFSNVAHGDFSSISGGQGNLARGDRSTITSGYSNIADGDYSSVSGGYSNTAIGDSSSVSGGLDNTASGSISSISGGHTNTASGDYSSISGGFTNTITIDGAYSSIGGGQDQESSTPYEFLPLLP